MIVFLMSFVALLYDPWADFENVMSQECLWWTLFQVLISISKSNFSWQVPKLVPKFVPGLSFYLVIRLFLQVPWADLRCGAQCLACATCTPSCNPKWTFCLSTLWRCVWTAPFICILSVLWRHPMASEAQVVSLLNVYSVHTFALTNRRVCPQLEAILDHAK